MIQGAKQCINNDNNRINNTSKIDWCQSTVQFPIFLLYFININVITLSNHVGEYVKVTFTSVSITKMMLTIHAKYSTTVVPSNVSNTTNTPSELVTSNVTLSHQSPPSTTTIQNEICNNNQREAWSLKSNSFVVTKYFGCLLSVDSGFWWTWRRIVWISFWLLLFALSLFSHSLYDWKRAYFCRRFWLSLHCSSSDW